VLPLDNLSGDSSQDYFADGMTDELITMLAKESSLRIVSRTSVMQYRGARRPLPEIARALHADAILEGSVSRSADQVHMNLQLIRADTDSHLWADSYERDANDLALPDEAAKAIANQLHRAVPAVKANRYVNPAAHDAYLHGNYLWFGTHMEESGAWFQKAIDLQPDYALAWAGLADYYGEGVVVDVLDPRTSIVPEEQAAERALELDPNLPQAHQAMAAMFLIDRWDWADADREILRAISLDPQNGELYYLRACLLQAVNRNAEAIELGKKSMEIDPFSRPYALAGLYVCAPIRCGAQGNSAAAGSKSQQSRSPRSGNGYVSTYGQLQGGRGRLGQVAYSDGRSSVSRGPAACLGSGRCPRLRSLAAWPASPPVEESLRLSCRAGELLRTAW
jgi:TolB-like protein